MKNRTRRTFLKEIGVGLVCLLAICLAAFTIFSTYQLRETVSSIYAHPYTVSNESRAMIQAVGHEGLFAEHRRQAQL